MLTLQVEKRTILGKTARRMTREVLSAVLYGKKQESTSIQVPRAAFKKILKEAGESTVVTLTGMDKDLEVLIHEVDFDPIKGEPRHADFYVLEKGQKVKVNVPLHFEGVSNAVKNMGGILIKVMHEIEVEAEPQNLPHAIVVDIEKLGDFNSQIHVRDISFPNGVVSAENPESVVAAIAEPREEKEEDTAPVDLTAIEVAKKGKKDEEGGATDEGEQPADKK